MGFGNFLWRSHQLELVVGNGESISLVEVAGAQSFFEPEHSLFRSSVIKAFRLNSLSGVVVVSPATRMKISLKLESNGESIVFGFRNASLLVGHEVGLARKLVNMMPHLVGNDVDISKVTTTSHGFLAISATSSLDIRTFSLIIQTHLGRLEDGSSNVYHVSIIKFRLGPFFLRGLRRIPGRDKVNFAFQAFPGVARNDRTSGWK